MASPGIRSSSAMPNNAWSGGAYVENMRSGFELRHGLLRSASLEIGQQGRPEPVRPADPINCFRDRMPHSPPARGEPSWDVQKSQPNLSHLLSPTPNRPGEFN